MRTSTPGCWNNWCSIGFNWILVRFCSIRYAGIRLSMKNLRWLKTVSSTFQDVHVDFDGSLLPPFISWCYNCGIKKLPNHWWTGWYYFRDTVDYMKVKSDHHSEFSNLSNWKEEAWKSQGFNGIQTRDLRDTGAMLCQLSYEATHWERGQFIEFISPMRSEMMWSI